MALVRRVGDHQRGSTARSPAQQNRLISGQDARCASIANASSSSSAANQVDQLRVQRQVHFSSRSLTAKDAGQVS